MIRNRSHKQLPLADLIESAGFGTHNASVPHLKAVISAVHYTDVTIGYEFDTFGESMNLFFTVNNLFDKKPPLIPGTIAPEFGILTNAIYDLFGRIYTLGARFGF